MLAWHLALRYLRRRRASWLAFTAVTLTVAVPVIVLGVMQGWTEITHRQIRAAETDLTVRALTRRGTLWQSEQLAGRLRNISGVEAAVPFIDTTAALVPTDNPNHIIGVKIDGIDYRQDRAIGRMREAILHKPPIMDLKEADLPPERRGSGFLTRAARAHLTLSAAELLAPLAGAPLPSPPRLQPFRPGLIVGRELAMLNPYHLGLGAEAKLVIPDGSGGTIGRLTVEVSDTMGTGVYEIDRYTTALSLPVTQYLTMMDGRHPNSEGMKELTGYRLTLTDPAAWPAVNERLTALPLLYARHWTQLRSGMVGSLKAYERLIVVVMIAIQLLCIFIVYAVFSTLVAEKRHDIGVLKGLGAASGSIVRTFLLAGIVVCVSGGLLGWGIGWGILLILNPICDFFGVSLFPQEVIYTAVTPVSFDPRYPLLFLGLIATIGLGATALPAWRAGRIRPIDTIREAG